MEHAEMEKHTCNCTASDVSTRFFVAPTPLAPVEWCAMLPLNMLPLTMLSPPLARLLGVDAPLAYGRHTATVTATVTTTTATTVT
jgi:hypothetical protein